MKNGEIKFETLKKSYKKYFIGGVIAVCIIGGALTFRLTHSKYRFTQSIDLAEGVIHYKAPDFQVMAIKVSDDGENYSDSDVIPTGSYAINEDKTYCKTSSGEEVKGKIRTVNGIHGLYNIAKGDKCYLYFDKVITVVNILAGLNTKTTTPDFSNIAATDEGVYQTSDGTNMYSGTTYYWRGAVKNNYVKFANFCWRIIRINGDKTIRLIYDGETCHVNGTNTTESIAVTSQKYNTRNNQSNYVGWTYNDTSQRTLSGSPSIAKSQTENWYKTNIADKGFDGKVAYGKFCNDRNAASESTWAISPSGAFFYAAYSRRVLESPTFSCTDSGDVYTLNVGAITADEVAYAGGGKYSTSNTSYYLYNGQDYWTMSPRQWVPTNVSVFAVESDGALGGWKVSNTGIGLRPVINLKADTVFASGGTGEQNSPYIVQ